MLSPTSHYFQATALRISKQTVPGCHVVERESNETYGTEKQFSVDDNNSLELMIRAHERIRTLEQDNQILRLHVELLSKDNKELAEKLQKIHHERTTYSQSSTSNNIQTSNFVKRYLSQISDSKDTKRKSKFTKLNIKVSLGNREMKNTNAYPRRIFYRISIIPANQNKRSKIFNFH